MILHEHTLHTRKGFFSLERFLIFFQVAQLKEADVTYVITSDLTVDGLFGRCQSNLITPHPPDEAD